MNSLGRNFEHKILLRQTRYRGTRSKLQLFLEFNDLDDGAFTILYVTRLKDVLIASDGTIIDPTAHYEISGWQNIESERVALATYFHRQQIEPWNAAVLEEVEIRNWLSKTG